MKILRLPNKMRIINKVSTEFYIRNYNNTVVYYIRGNFVMLRGDINKDYTTINYIEDIFI